jgi:hypothetical protein
MIRFRRLNLNAAQLWFTELTPPAKPARFRLRAWRENRAELPQIQREVIEYIDEAFQDARARLRRGFDVSLSPFRDRADDPAANYPGMLHRKTLQGYFGEMLGVLAVEHWGAHGFNDWQVPALLFRYHEVEFQHLELINERLADNEVYDPERPGRTGDDAIAFRIDENDVITDVLPIEAKCLSEHHTDTVSDAHKKISDRSRRPVSILELINLLEDYATPKAERWQRALLSLRSGEYRNTTRHDAVAYACGTVPRQQNRLSWMAGDAPHADYTGGRNLEAMEFQIPELGDLINILYRGE